MTMIIPEIESALFDINTTWKLIELEWNRVVESGLNSVDLDFRFPLDNSSLCKFRALNFQFPLDNSSVYMFREELDPSGRVNRNGDVLVGIFVEVPEEYTSNDLRLFMSIGGHHIEQIKTKPNKFSLFLREKTFLPIIKLAHNEVLFRPEHNILPPGSKCHLIWANISTHARRFLVLNPFRFEDILFHNGMCGVKYDQKDTWTGLDGIAQKIHQLPIINVKRKKIRCISKREPKSKRHRENDQSMSVGPSSF